ncbi:MAG TPA: hypothetical protein VKY85_08810 [Candidatus Angelobacter sp.]|nr:hypothetical protein [Candidatus Angelobacter sp.]
MSLGLNGSIRKNQACAGTRNVYVALDHELLGGAGDANSDIASVSYEE